MWKTHALALLKYGVSVCLLCGKYIGQEVYAVQQKHLKELYKSSALLVYPPCWLLLKLFTGFSLLLFPRARSPLIF